MKTSHPTLPRRKSVTALAAGLLLLWTAIQLLVSLPALHHALHPDSASPDHHCFITELASGQGVVAAEPLCLTPPPLAHPTLGAQDAPAGGFSFQLPQAPRPPPAAATPSISAGSTRV